MDDPYALGDLPPDRFGEVVAAVLRDVWDGVVDVSPPSPGGTVEAIVEDGGRLVHVHQATRVDEEVVDEVATVAAERGFEAATLATTGIVTEEARGTAEAAGVSAIDGDALSGLAGSADIEATGDAGTASSLAEQFAGHWPGPMRERAVEAADAVDGVAEFDRDVTRATGLTDLDFHHGDPEEPVVRLRFTGTSFLVYVRGQDDLESVVRLSAYRVHQPPLPADLTDRIRSALGTGSD